MSFKPDSYCPDSIKQFHHNNVITRRCEWCGLLNPNFIVVRESSIKSESNIIGNRGASVKSKPEVVDLLDDSPATPSRPIPPAQRRGMAALHIPIIPKLEIGHANREVKAVNERIKAREKQVGIDTRPFTIHFSLGLARFTWDDAGDSGRWDPWPQSWTVSEANRFLTSDELQRSLKANLKPDKKRSKMNKWLFPKEEGTWTLCHHMPAKSGASKDIASWDEPRLLSEVLDSGPYVVSTVQGKNSKVYSLFFCWMPDPVTPELSPTTSPAKTPSKNKTSRKIKSEPSPEASTAKGKRPRSFTSSELASLSKRSGATTRRRAQAVTQLEDVDDDELPPFEELLKSEG